MAASSASTPPTTHRKGFILALIGSAALLSPLIGITLTLREISLEFDQIIIENLPSADPGITSGAIGQVLLATALSYVLSLLGAIAIVLAAHHLHYRARWMLRVMIFGLLLWLPAFPIGTLLGLAGLAVLRKNAAALTGATAPSSPLS
jgi:hypothetical protein